MSVPLQCSDFATHVDETFVLSVEGAERSLDAELIEATESASPPAPGTSRKPFSLQFKLPPGTGLGQGMMNLCHTKLPELSLFLVPIGADENGWYMEACFN